jgi:hypothetical protein
MWANLVRVIDIGIIKSINLLERRFKDRSEIS